MTYLSSAVKRPFLTVSTRTQHTPAKALLQLSRFSCSKPFRASPSRQSSKITFTQPYNCCHPPSKTYRIGWTTVYPGTNYSTQTSLRRLLFTVVPIDETALLCEHYCWQPLRLYLYKYLRLYFVKHSQVTQALGQAATGFHATPATANTTLPKAPEAA